MAITDTSAWKNYSEAEKSAMNGLKECIFNTINANLYTHHMGDRDAAVSPLLSGGWTEAKDINAFRLGKRIKLRELLNSKHLIFHIGNPKNCRKERKTLRGIVSGHDYRWTLREEPKKSSIAYRHELFPGSLVLVRKWGESVQTKLELDAFLPETATGFLNDFLTNTTVKKYFIQSLEIKPSGSSRSWNESGGYDAVSVYGSTSYSGRDAGHTHFRATKTGKAGQYSIETESSMGFIRSPIEISASKFDRSL